MTYSCSHVWCINMHIYIYTYHQSFSIIVGIGMDYDIFLLTRVVEYRKAGYSTRESILKGLAKTGGIITAAGVYVYCVCVCVCVLCVCVWVFNAGVYFERPG